uniref:FH2 domain-containing protein n=1 Tax=Knipowitschia caucasica TaxID=637954 RepID=A0AAV2LFT1_KNICA
MLIMSVPSTRLDPESSSEATSSSTSATTSDSSKHAAPPAPPLPPPPPPSGAPPPPPLPGNHGGRKKRRVRSFFWKPIPEEKVREKPNIWTMAVQQQQQFQIDVRSVEELFGQQEEGGGRGTATAIGTSTQVSRTRSFKEGSKEEISILDSKRAMNVGIFLKQFKKSNRTIVEDIRRGDGQKYGAELLKDLLKLLPDVEEVKKLQAFKGDPDKLALVDAFMYLLIQVPQFELRIEAMVLREEFSPSCTVMSNEIHVIRVATKELMGCEELHAILHLVLQAGNIMNAGGYAGNAVGFKLSSLLSLADTKANKPGMNLLHFVAMEAKKKDEKLLKFPEKLQDVQSAARISVENIETEYSSLYVRIRTLEEKVQGDPELLQQLQPFLQSAAQTLQDLKRRRLELRKEGNSLIDFFCEDKDTFKLDECFRIFQDFCHKFKKAVKDNTERELKEAARQRRLRELEQRRSAWSGPDQSGGFARSSSETDVDMLTKEGLLEFIHRSQSPLSRSTSARRHRHTMTSTADRQLQGYLEVFGQNDNDCSKFNSLPRPGRPHQRRTTPWMLAQDDNRELGWDRLVDVEPISPLAKFSSPGLNDNADSYTTNDQYTSVSEGSSRRGDRQPENTETRRALRDQSTPARGRSEKATRTPRHSSMPPDESKVQRGLSGSTSRWTRESTPRKATTYKPSAKPLRNIPKPEEKMCRSTMRALAQSQTQANAENTSPNTAKSSSDVPSFARNTVAFSSRTKKEPSTPSRSPSTLAKQAKPSKPPSSEERPVRRVQSVRAASRNTYRSETPPPSGSRDDQRKTSSFSEKSIPGRDLATSRSAKPGWK